MNGHRSSFGKGKRCLLYQHSHKEGHGSKLENFHVQPIEVLKNGTTCAERRRREAWWMKELKSLYPYGLNDKCGNHYYSEYHKDKLVYSVFNTQPIKRKQRGKGKEEMLIMS